MARISSEEAAKMAGGSRFLLVIMAAQRTKELARGSRPKIDPKGHSHSIVALKEIEQGFYTLKDYLETLNKGNDNEYHSSQGKRNSERNPRFDPIY